MSATRKLNRLDGGGAVDFIDEDIESESLILEALSWTKNGGDPSDLQQTLKSHSENLNVEIIDFLLQWENDERVGVSRGTRPDTGEGNFRDTFRVLEALQEVDGELKGVDDWLEEQIDHLSQIKSKLSLIEAETGALESSWQNLSAVESMLENILSSLSLSAEDELLLLRPDAVIERAVKSLDLDRSSNILRPLIEAVTHLKDTIAASNGAVPEVKPSQWKHLKAVAAITQQKKRLADLAYNFGVKFSPTACSIFNSVLKHKALHDGLYPEQCIDLRSLNFTVVVREGFQFSNYLSDVYLYPAGAAFTNEPPLKLIPNPLIHEYNAALLAQQAYHRPLSHFAPLIETLMELSPSLKPAIYDAYVRSTHEKLYSPMLKVVFKELQSLMVTKGPIVTLGNIPKYRLAERQSYQPMVRFIPPMPIPSKSVRGDRETASEFPPFTPWSALGAALLIIAPIIKREETFFLSLFKVDATGMGEMLLNSDGSPVPKSKAEELLDILFEGLPSKLLRPGGTPGTITGGAAATAAGITGGNEPDGIEAIGMLMVLQQYMVDYLGLVPADSLTNERDNMHIVSGINSNTGTNNHPATSTGTNDNHSISSNSMGYYKIEDYCGYLVAMLSDVRASLLRRLRAYLAEQVLWIQQQKGDPKKPGVQGVVSRFPALIRQALEMTGGQRIDFVEQFLFRIGKELFQWIGNLAEQNDKYSDVVKILNFNYLIEAASPMGVQALEKFGLYAAQQVRDAEKRYVQWMIAYEFPALSNLATRVEGVGGRVNEEELSLYIRRKDVMSVIKELTQKVLIESITSMFKRLEKHFGAAGERDNDLVPKLWLKLRDRVVTILERLEEAATMSYQISLEVGPQTVAMMFDRFAGSQ